jgi:hypothetical protein
MFGQPATMRPEMDRARRLQRRGAGLLAAATLVAGGAFISTGAHAHAGFTAGTSYTLPAQEADMVEGDFNGDGNTDLAVFGADLVIYLGNGDGTFTAQTPITLPSNFAGGVQLLTGDFNGDGKLDLVLDGWQNNSGVLSQGIWLMTGKGDGTFNAATLIESPGSAPGSIAAGDFNGDGKLDLAYSFANGINAVYGNGHGVFSTGFSYSWSEPTPGRMVVGDFDHDGKDDIAIGAVGGSISEVVVFRDEAILNNAYPLADPTDLVTGDFNGDGYPDIASAGGVLWGQSNGLFATPDLFTVPGTPGAVTTAAIDADGSVSLVVAGNNAGSGVVQTVHNLAGSGMTVASQYPGLATPLSVVSGDFNGDGRPDLAVLSSTTLQIVIGNHDPAAPENVTAVAGIGSATVSWDPSLDDGGSAITGYEVDSSGGASVSVGPGVTQVVLAGLAASPHTFTVTATNAFATSPPSTASNTVDPQPGGTTNPLTPARILDTRTSNGGHDYPLGPGQTLTLQVSGRGGVPSSDVSAVMLNVTVTDATASSFLAVWPAGLTRPTVSNINFHAGEALPNLVEVALGSTGGVSFFNAAGTVDVIADVEGWVGDNTNSFGNAGLFDALPPTRILDTRTGNGGHEFPLGAGETLTLQVAGRGNVPSSDAGAVTMNVTVANATAASYLTVWPTGVTRPVASNLNFAAGETIPNRVTVGLGSGGQVNFYNALGNVNVIADVNGFFTGSGSTFGGSGFVGVAPTRIIDTRAASTCAPYKAPCPIGQGGEWVEAIASGESALVMNVTATQPTASSYMTVFPNPSAGEWGGTAPDASDLNFSAGETIANFTTVDLGPSPESGYLAMVFYNAEGNVDLIADVDGYYGTVLPAPPTGGPIVLKKSFDSRHAATALRPLQSRRAFIAR